MARCGIDFPELDGRPRMRLRSVGSTVCLDAKVVTFLYSGIVKGYSLYVFVWNVRNRCDMGGP